MKWHFAECEFVSETVEWIIKRVREGKGENRFVDSQSEHIWKEFGIHT